MRGNVMSLLFSFYLADIFYRNLCHFIPPLALILHLGIGNAYMRFYASIVFTTVNSHFL